MKILVTGANGQLGQCLRDCVLQWNEKDEWFWTDVNDMGRAVEHLDITKAEDVLEYMKKHGIEVVVNCAAATNVDGVEDNIPLARMLNVTAPKNLADACKELNARLIHVSTDFVFEGEDGSPRKEDDDTNPISVYGITKREGEAEIENSGCDYLIFRTAWLYSEYGNNFVKTMMKLIREKGELRVVDDQIGTPTYARSLAMTIFYAITNKPEATGIYHYTNDGACSWYDFAFMIQEIMKELGEDGLCCQIKPTSTENFYNGKPHAPRPHYSVLSKEKVKSDFFSLITEGQWTLPLRKCINNLMNEEND